MRFSMKKKAFPDFNAIILDSFCATRRLSWNLREVESKTAYKTRTILKMPLKTKLLHNFLDAIFKLTFCTCPQS